MERYISKFSFLSLLLITFFGCDYIDDLLTIQDLYNPDDEILELYMNQPFDGENYLVDYDSPKNHWYVSVEFESLPKTRVFWSSPDSFTIYHNGYPITNPIVNYSSYARDDGSGKQMVYLNRSMIGKRLSVVGCVNKNLCEVLTFQLK